jgi:hypothetical protein
MSNDLKCSYWFGTGQKIEMTPAKFGKKLPPYQPCPSCGGTGIPPKPIRVNAAPRDSKIAVTAASASGRSRDSFNSISESLAVIHGLC